jgi:uncharacterized protein (TIGR02147 family)
MNKLFTFQDYRAYLRSLVYAPETKRGYQVAMAKAIGCQAAYLSQVIKGKSEFTEDHALKLAQFLRLSPPGIEYLVLLVRQSRASSPALREYLEQRRIELSKDQEEVKSRVNSKTFAADESTLFRYFSSGLPSLIHMATSSEKLRTVEALATRFRLPPARVGEILAFLEEINLVEKKGSHWRYASPPLHFPRESAINIVHQLGRRNQAMRAIEENDPNDLHFSSVFTLDAETYAKLKTDLLDHIESSHRRIHAGGTTEVYSMCLDLFRAV